MEEVVLEPSTEHENIGVEANASDGPKKSLSPLQWKGFLASIYLAVAINGYDVSNVANIQPRIYEAFHDIKLLPWVGLSYSLANFATLIFARKIILCFNMRYVYLAFLVVFMVGASISGAAPNMASVIIGRSIMGVGGAVVQQCNMSSIAIWATSLEAQRIHGLVGASFAIGLVVGGPIGSALAADAHATWRWAFYFNLPCVGLAFAMALICAPSHSIAHKTPILQRIGKIDPLGIVFSVATPVLFAIALTFSGSVWTWGSGPSVAIWVVLIVILALWLVQQYFCFFTTAKERALPLHILQRLDLIPIWVATASAGAIYAIVLYYTPLYFAFVQGTSELGQTVRLLPFIFVFIVISVFTGRLLPVIARYNIFFIIAGTITLVTGIAMAITLDERTSSSQILGLEALLGIGVGMSFQSGAAICSALVKDGHDRVDASVIATMAQMGGIAVVLAVAGSIYQNVGFHLLLGALEGQNLSDNDIREALAGVSSVVWQSNDLAQLQRSVHAVATVIGREFWIVATSGLVCLICGLTMSWEKLDLGRPAKDNKEDQSQK
ncbi:MFS general substrate transporter [Thozetella sp. PMI_491]|nr:MFS general substrate transporter [Thozetella sp. PMI_491]